MLLHLEEITCLEHRSVCGSSGLNLTPNEVRPSRLCGTWCSPRINNTQFSIASSNSSLFLSNAAETEAEKAGVSFAAFDKNGYKWQYIWPCQLPISSDNGNMQATHSQKDDDPRPVKRLSWDRQKVHIPQTRQRNSWSSWNIFYSQDKT